MTSRFPWQDNCRNLVFQRNLPYHFSTRHQAVWVPEKEMIDLILYIQCDLSSVPLESSTAGRPRLGIEEVWCTHNLIWLSHDPLGLVYHIWELP